MGKKTISLDREVLHFTLFLFAVKGSEEEKKRENHFVYCLFFIFHFLSYPIFREMWLSIH